MGARTGRPRGRPKGAKNKRTQERMRAMQASAKAIEAALPEAFDGDAHDLLVAVYKNPQHEWNLRVDAAKAAIRYEKPALSTVESVGKDGGPIQQVHRIERVVVDPAGSEG